MNIKRYIVNDNAEAMRKIKEELGSEAVIINSRKIRQPGLLGFFKKPMFEVVAAVDEKGDDVPEIEVLETAPINVKTQANNIYAYKQNQAILELEREEAQEVLDEEDYDDEYAEYEEEYAQDDELLEEIKLQNEEIDTLKDELSEIKSMIASLIVPEEPKKRGPGRPRKVVEPVVEEVEEKPTTATKQSTTAKTATKTTKSAAAKTTATKASTAKTTAKAATAKAAAAKTPATKAVSSRATTKTPTKVEKPVELTPEEKFSAFKEKYNKYYTNLIDRNVKPEIVDSIFMEIFMDNNEVSTDVEFYENLKNILLQKIGKVFTTDISATNRRKIFLFLGPTGVGKTTTIAKIAARLSIFEKKKVALITADTYRIAAVDQLKTYSEILNLPIGVVYEAHELQTKLKAYNKADYVLVDTAGRNHKSDSMKEDAQALSNELQGATKFVVISLSTSKKDIESIIKSYEFLGEYKLVFTKLDETENVGNILNARVASGMQISFITNGQNVPDDLYMADELGIVKLLLGDET